MGIWDWIERQTRMLNELADALEKEPPNELTESLERWRMNMHSTYKATEEDRREGRDA